MFVSTSMVFEALSEHFELILHKKLDYTLTLSSAEFLTKNTIPQNGKIYILNLLKNEDGFSAPSGQMDLLLTIGKSTPELLSRCACLIELPGDASPCQVLNVVSQVLEKYQRWDNTLRSIVFRDGTAEELLECSTPIFGNPIGIHNDALECIYESDIPGQDGVKLMERNRSRRKNAEYIKALMEDVEFQRTFQLKGAFFSDASSTKGCTLSQNLFLYDQFAYRIVITERYRKLKPQDLYLLEHLASYIKIVLTPNCRQFPDERRPFFNFLTDVLDGTIHDLQTIERYIRGRGWRSSDYFVCATFTINTRDVFGVSPSAISAYLKRLMKNSEVFLYQQHIVAIVDVGDKFIKSTEISHRFSEYMRDMNMKAGVSNAVQGAQCIRDLYRQSTIALEMGANLWDYLWIYHFSHVAPYYIMERCLGELTVKTICTPEIMEILRYDAENRTDYFHTLKVHLECNLNLTTASAQLFIHRTTLLYRLDKIRTLFSVDERDPIKRFYYQLSMQLIQYTSYQIEAGLV